MSVKANHSAAVSVFAMHGWFFKFLYTSFIHQTYVSTKQYIQGGPKSKSGYYYDYDYY